MTDLSKRRGVSLRKSPRPPRSQSPILPTAAVPEISPANLAQASDPLQLVKPPLPAQTTAAHSAAQQPLASAATQQPKRNWSLLRRGKAAVPPSVSFPAPYSVDWVKAVSGRLAKPNALFWLVLAIVTYGFYPLLWLYRNVPLMEEISGQRIASAPYLMLMFLIYGAAIYQLIVFEQDGSYYRVALFGVWLVWLLAWWPLLRLRRALRFYVHYRFQRQLPCSILLTLLLPGLYLNRHLRQQFNRLQRIP